MNAADFLASFWWMIFPVFGMAMAILGAASTERMKRARIDLAKAYVERGQAVPADLAEQISRA